MHSDKDSSSYDTGRVYIYYQDFRVSHTHHTLSIQEGGVGGRERGERERESISSNFSKIGRKLKKDIQNHLLHALNTSRERESERERDKEREDRERERKRES